MIQFVPKYCTAGSARDDQPWAVRGETRLQFANTTSADTMFPFPWSAPPYPNGEVPFASTWVLSHSTAIHTSNQSGFSDPTAAAKFGIVSFDHTNAQRLWLTPGNPSNSTCEATLLEQARLVKSVRQSTHVYVYRNAMEAIQWMESSRAVMYDERYRGYFLRCATGQVWHRGHDSKTGSCGPGVRPDPKGDIFFWNFSNASAAEYFASEVVNGPRGAGSPLIDGIFMDDPGPGSAHRPMAEYRDSLLAAARGIGIDRYQLEVISRATVATVARVQRLLHANGKGLWVNGVEYTNPFHEIGLLEVANTSATTCRAPWRDRCGWWAAPQPGDACISFYRKRCAGRGGILARSTPMAVHLQADDQQHAGPNATSKWRLTIGTLLLLRGRDAWIVASDWQQTSASTSLLWSESLERDAGAPAGECIEEAPGVFSRQWSAGLVRIDCAAVPADGVRLPWDRHD